MRYSVDRWGIEFTMTKLELFKNLPFDGITSIPYFSSETAQNAYFDAYGDKLILDCTYIKIGTPILVSYDYDTLTAYPYGRVKSKNKWYYFTITNLDVIGDNKTQITYSFDCFTTAYRPYGLTIGNCHVTKRASKPSYVISQGIQPIRMEPKLIANTTGGAVFFTATKQNTAGHDQLIYGMCYTEGVGYEETLKLVEGNLWDEFFGIQPSSIKNVWYVPVGAFVTYVLAHWTKDTYGNGNVYYTGNSSLMPNTTINLGAGYTADDLHQYHVTDSDGLICWTCPTQRTISGAYLALEMTTNTCNIAVFMGSNTQETAIAGMSVRIPCKAIDFFIDSYSEYASAFRQIEIQERKIQNEKALVSGLSGSVQTAAFGALGGGPAGAIAGLAGGIVSATAEYAVNYIYEGSVQDLEDAKYRNSQDSFTVFGNSMRSYFQGPTPAICVVEMEGDAYSIARYNAKVSEYGYDVNEYYNDISMIIGSGYYAMECEIMGNVLMDWKNQIAGKLSAGVRIVMI